MNVERFIYDNLIQNIYPLCLFCNTIDWRLSGQLSTGADPDNCTNTYGNIFRVTSFEIFIMIRTINYGSAHFSILQMAYLKHRYFLTFFTFFLQN